MYCVARDDRKQNRIGHEIEAKLPIWWPCTTNTNQLCNIYFVARKFFAPTSNGPHLRRAAMIHLEGWPAIFFAIAILAISVILVMLYFFVIRAWVRAVLYGAPIPMVTILTMRLRGNPPILLIDAYSALRRAGARTSISEV